MEDRTEFLNYINSRPLDVHRWSEYPEVNEFVNEIYSELISINGHETTSKKLVKVILLDLYVAWCTDTDLMIMFSKGNSRGIIQLNTVKAYYECKDI